MPKLILIIFGFLSITSLAQKEYDTIVIRDLESWTSATFQLKLNKKMSFELSPQLRLEKNSSQIERVLSDFGFEYRLNKNFEFGVGYRLYSENKKKGYQLGHRYNLDAKYNFGFSRFDGSVRLRYQSGTELGSTENIWGNDLRLKTKLGYNIKKWKLDPDISAELFHTVGEKGNNRLNKMRITLGSSYKFNKEHSISFFYGLERELNETYPKATYLIGIGYKYTLKPAKDEK